MKLRPALSSLFSITLAMGAVCSLEACGEEAHPGGDLGPDGGAPAPVPCMSGSSAVSYSAAGESNHSSLFSVPDHLMLLAPGCWIECCFLRVEQAEANLAILVQIGVYGAGPRMPGMEECLWRFVWEIAGELEIDHERCKLIRRVWRADYDNSEQVQTRCPAANVHAFWKRARQNGMLFADSTHLSAS